MENAEKIVREQLPHCLEQIELEGFGDCIRGKVRDSYRLGSSRILIASDRLSCFDVIVTTLPFKGQVLSALAKFFFERTKEIISNHTLSIPHPNVMIVRECEVLPIEVVVRGYLAGSAWRNYKAGEDVSGVKLPSNLKEFSALPEVVLTPSTKAEKGSHDEPISEKDILSRKIVDPLIWGKVKEAALKLYEDGSNFAASRDLILVDTKYEFGILNGEVYLVDEIHTLDSSRYWDRNTYEAKLSRGEAPDMLDKEPARRWLMEQGYMGDGIPPKFSEEKRVELALHYINSYERITGFTFEATIGSQLQDIQESLQRA